MKMENKTPNPSPQPIDPKAQGLKRISTISQLNIYCIAICYVILHFLYKGQLGLSMGLSYFGLLLTPEGNANTASAVMFILMMAMLTTGETYIGLLQTKLGHRVGYLRFGLSVALIGVMFPFDRFAQTHTIAANIVYGLLLVIAIMEMGSFRQPGKVIIAHIVATAMMMTIFILYLVLLRKPELVWIAANTGVLQKAFVAIFFASEAYRHHYGDSDGEANIGEILTEKGHNMKLALNAWLARVKTKFQMAMAGSEDPVFVKRLVSVEKAVQEQTAMMKKLLTLIDGLMGLQIDKQIDTLRAEIAALQQKVDGHEGEMAKTLSDIEHKETKLAEIMAMLIDKFKPSAQNYKPPFPMEVVGSK